MNKYTSFSELFEQRCHADPFHVAKWAIEKEFGETGRNKIPEALKDACEKEMRFLSQLATEEIEYRKNKAWTKKKQRELEEYYMFEWMKNNGLVSRTIWLWAVLRINDEVREVSEYIRAMVNIALIRYELGNARILDSNT